MPAPKPKQAKPASAPAAKQTQLSDVACSNQLLEYYQSRIDGFERERQELLDKVEACGVAHADLHRLEWENKKRADEVRELQKALSDAHTYLFEERERLLRMQAENDELRLQEVEDRKRIQHLLSITAPLEQQITYGRDARPAALTLFPRGDPDAAAGPGPSSAAQQQRQHPHAQPHQQAQQRGAAQQPRPAAGGSGEPGGGGGGERVMRTVFLPVANTDALMLKVESLQAQLNEQKQFAGERIAALLEDRRIREQDEAAHRRLLQQQVDELTERLKKAERTLQATTKDYILARKDRQEAAQRASAAQAELAAEQRRAAAELAEVRTRAAEELAQTQAGAQEKFEEYTTNFRQQIKRREQDISDLESVHAAVKAQNEERIAELDVRASKLADANKQLEYRRALDVEGWTADVTLLRKQLAAVDRKLHQMRLANRLQDDERLDAILEDLQRRAPSVLGDVDTNSQSSGRSGRSATSEAAADLKRVKGGLGALQDKLAAAKRGLRA